MSEPAALELADKCEQCSHIYGWGHVFDTFVNAAVMLREQHAEIARLTALVADTRDAVRLVIAYDRNVTWRSVADVDVDSYVTGVRKLKGGA